MGQAGQRHEAGLGLYDYGARYYDPLIGRFISADTVVPSPGDPQSLNRYAYVQNNPLVYTDPSGHFANVIVGAVIGAVIGAAVSAGPQIIQNVREGQPLTTNIDPGEVAKAAAIGAVGGAVAGATFGVALAAAPAVGLGTGLGAHVAAGAASGVVAGQASRATGNVLNGQRITQGLGNPGEMARDAALGGAGGAVGYGIERVASGIAVSRQAAIDDIVQTEFQNVRLTQYPKYDPGMPLNQYGEAAYNSYTKVGPSAINGGRGETLITIAHEEMHHRLWARGWPQSEAYVERVAQRFARLKGW